MRLSKLVLLTLTILMTCVSSSLLAQVTLEFVSEPVMIEGGDLRFNVVTEGLEGLLPARVLVDGERVVEIDLVPGENSIVVEDGARGGSLVQVVTDRGVAEGTIRTIPGWLSILPPLIAILLAIVFRDVLLSLTAGIFSGALIYYDWNPLVAFARTVDKYVLEAIADTGHASVLIFSTLLGGMIGLIAKSGGTEGIVQMIQGRATSRRRGQLATWVMGLFIFFDDYANSLLVGSTMRPVTDKLRISREKLSYIVDSTAAPVSSFAPISTWVGFEIGVIVSAFTAVGLDYNGYGAFLASIPYRFYPLLALFMVFMIASSGRDFGPMLKAERRALTTGKVIADDARPLADYGADGMQADPETPKRAINAIAPILTVIIVTAIGLWITGSAGTEAGLSGFDYVREVLGNSDSYSALMWGSLSGVIVALVMPLLQRIVPLTDLLSGMVQGFKAMLLALVVLVLAWGIGAVTQDLHTAEFVVGVTEGFLSPHWIGAIVFVLAAAIAFATGTSYGTMGILMPIVVPVAHGLATGAGFMAGTDAHYSFLLASISSVLAGSVWGDHCSPISDTTILSSMASGSDHIAHVRTQMPYALVVGFVGIIVGDIPTGYGLSPWISLLIGAATIVAIVMIFGRKAEEVEAGFSEPLAEGSAES